jgi:hypothetical protein
MVFPANVGSNVTVSPETALRIACRSEPGPLSFVFVTMRDAAYAAEIPRLPKIVANKAIVIMIRTKLEIHTLKNIHLSLGVVISPYNVVGSTG